MSIADVRDRAALSSAVADGVAQLGHLDGVIAQAGICPFGETDPQAFFDTVQVDFNGVVNSIEAALPHLGSGASVIATGSLGAMITGSTDKPERGTGGIGYSFAKRTLAALVHDLAFVLAAQSIRVNALHPTNCNTDLLHNDQMYKAYRPDLANPTREDAEQSFPNFNAMPVGWVEPEDIAAAGLFLISDESRYVTGMQMRVDAGCYVKNRPAQPYF
jgi:NAD(P)-dependent dehydrogenase (short-subunit alcohol dehydrogenase family)